MPTQKEVPELFLIAGCTGAGKSTLGMTIALNQGILRCISTDAVRQVMRTYSTDPAIHRATYSGTGDPVVQWRECCEVLTTSIDGVVEDCIHRGVSLVLEGVHIIPSNNLLERWRSKGGVALGCVLAIKDEKAHRDLLERRGQATHKGADSQIKAFDRIRAIQEEIVRLGQASQWLHIEQKIEPDPVDMLTDSLK